tara:strand:- start:6977 stop:7699 length:723 start_codon:yes stop_codon:yes gene_type:complete
MVKEHSKILLELKDAGINRSNRWLVRNITLSVNEGEILTIIGPNGSGKSTTAKIALGILKPDSGSVILHTDKIAYVPQNLAIDWTLPLRVSDFMRLTNNITFQEITDALDMTGVAPLINKNMRNLSGGEFQRILLARAIATKPDLLILDEPVQGVDFTGEIALYNLINQVSSELNCGTILISHDLHFVMSTTNNVICLNGHICCSGSPKTIVQSKEFIDLFGASAAQTLSPYEHNHDHSH